MNKHKSNKIKENFNTVRHLNNGTDHRHSKSCCDQSSPARRTNTYARALFIGYILVTVNWVGDRKLIRIKYITINNGFLTWLPIGWYHSCQPIRSKAWKLLLLNRKFDMGISQWSLTKRHGRGKITLKMSRYFQWFTQPYISDNIQWSTKIWNQRIRIQPHRI